MKKAVPVDKNDTPTQENFLPGEQCLLAAKDRESAHCSKTETSLKVHKAGFPAPKITLKPCSIEKRLLAQACLKCSSKRKEKIDPRFESKKYMSLFRFQCLVCFATMKKNELISSVITSKRATPGKQDLAAFDKYPDQTNFRSPTSFLLDTDDRKFYQNAMASNSSISEKLFVDTNSRPIASDKQDFLSKNSGIDADSKFSDNSYSFQTKENNDAAVRKKFVPRNFKCSDGEILLNKTKSAMSSDLGCTPTTNDLNTCRRRHSNALLDAANIDPKVNVKCHRDSSSHSKKINHGYQRPYSRQTGVFSKNSSSEQQLKRVQKCGYLKPRQCKGKCSDGIRNSSGMSGSHMFDRTPWNSDKSSKNKSSFSRQPKAATIALLPDDVRKNKPCRRSGVSKTLKKQPKASDLKTASSFHSKEKAKVSQSMSRTERFNSKVSSNPKGKHQLSKDQRLECTQRQEKKSNSQSVTDTRKAEVNLNCLSPQTPAVVLPKQRLSCDLVSSVGTASEIGSPDDLDKSPLCKDIALIESKNLKIFPSVGSSQLNAVLRSSQSCDAEDTKSEIILNEANECNVLTVTKSKKSDSAVLPLTKSIGIDTGENDVVSSLDASANVELEAHNTVDVAKQYETDLNLASKSETYVDCDIANASVHLKKELPSKLDECSKAHHCESVQSSDELQRSLASDSVLLPAWFQDDLPTLQVKDTKRKRRLSVKQRLNNASPITEASNRKISSIEGGEPCLSPLKKQKVKATVFSFETDSTVTKNLSPEDNFDLSRTSDFVGENDFLVLDEISSPFDASTELETENLEDVAAEVSSTADEAMAKKRVGMSDCVAPTETQAVDNMLKMPVALSDWGATTDNIACDDRTTEVGMDSCADHYFTYKSLLYFWPITSPTIEEIQNMSDDDSDDKTNYRVSVKLVALENSGFVPKCFVEVRICNLFVATFISFTQCCRPTCHVFHPGNCIKELYSLV